jgi:hypothetical protein
MLAARKRTRARSRESGVSGAREGCLSGWWARQGSNLHGLLHRILSPARLPIPPRAHKQRGETTAKGGGEESFNWEGASSSIGHESNLRDHSINERGCRTGLNDFGNSQRKVARDCWIPRATDRAQDDGTRSDEKAGGREPFEEQQGWDVRLVILLSKPPS